MKKLLRHNEIIVPYIAQWSSESDYFIRPDKYAAEVDSLFTRGTRGQGDPQSVVMHPARQRECMWLKLCGLCGDKLTRSFTVDTYEDQRRRGPKTNPILASPPMCATCMTYSIATYPSVTELTEDPETKYLELLEWTLLQQWAIPAARSSAIDKLLNDHGKKVCRYLLAFVEKANVFTYENFVKELSGAEVKN